MIPHEFEDLIGPAQGRKIEGLPLLELDTMTVTELVKRGVTRTAARRIKAAFTVGRWLLHAEAEAGEGRAYIETPEDAYRVLQPRYLNERREHFDVILLTNKNRLIDVHRVSTGSLTGSSFHPREVYHPVIREGAAAVLFAHNHPTGDPSPSREDLDITHRLRSVGEALGVRVYDHIICGHSRFYSFRREGLL